MFRWDGWVVLVWLGLRCFIDISFVAVRVFSMHRALLDEFWYVKCSTNRGYEGWGLVLKKFNLLLLIFISVYFKQRQCVPADCCDVVHILYMYQV